MYIHTLFHVPHDGDLFPKELMGSVCVSLDKFLRYHELMRDRDVVQVIPLHFRDNEHLIRFPVNRLLCDVERFIGPQEIMEKYGMGYCYERAYDGRQIKLITPELLMLTKQYYDHHHRLLDGICRTYNNLVLVDMHSFSDETVQNDLLVPGRKTPDICIGTDPLFTNPDIIIEIESIIQHAGFSTALNYPYSGCMIPNHVISGAYEGRFNGIMLEFNKRVYCDEDGGSSWNRVLLLRDLVNQIADRIIYTIERR